MRYLSIRGLRVSARKEGVQIEAGGRVYVPSLKHFSILYNRTSVRAIPVEEISSVEDRRKTNLGDYV